MSTQEKLLSELATGLTLNVADLQIGAVEMKDATTDTRNTIKAASTLSATTDTALVVTLRDVVHGGNYVAQVDSTRPADTNAYAAGDVIGTATGSTAAIEFTNIGTAGSISIITEVTLRIDVTAVPSGMTTFRLHLYNVTPPSALGDNAAWDLPSGDRSSYLGYLDIGTPVDVGSTLYVQSDPTTRPNKPVKLLSTSLFGYLVTIGGYTPSSAANKSITLCAMGA